MTPNGLGLANAGPAIETIAPEVAWFAPHLPEVQAVEKRLARGCQLVEADHGVHTRRRPG